MDPTTWNVNGNVSIYRKSKNNYDTAQLFGYHQSLRSTRVMLDTIMNIEYISQVIKKYTCDAVYHMNIDFTPWLHSVP